MYCVECYEGGKCTDAIFAPRSLPILYEKHKRGLGLATDNSGVTETEGFIFSFIFTHKRNLLGGNPELVIVTISGH